MRRNAGNKNGRRQWHVEQWPPEQPAQEPPLALDAAAADRRPEGAAKALNLRRTSWLAHPGHATAVSLRLSSSSKSCPQSRQLYS